MRFVATADLQIGMPARGLGGEAAAFRHARIAVIDTLGRIARDHDASAVVIAGDLFDRVPVETADLARTLDAIAALGLPVLALPGNHDSDDPASVWRSGDFEDRCPPRLTVLRDEPVVLDGWAFHGAPLRTRRPDVPLTERLLATLPADHGPRVVVGHGAVDALAGDHGDPATLRLGELERHLDAGRARFVVLGDRHAPTRVDAAGRVWYPGAPEPTAFGDGPGSALVVDLGAADAPAATPTVTQVTTGTWRFERRTDELLDASDVDVLLAAIAALERKASTVLKVQPRGALGLTDVDRLQRGLASAAASFAVLDPDLDHLATVPGIEELESLPLPAYAREVADALVDAIRTASDRGDEDLGASDELKVLLRFAAEVGR